MDEANVTHCAPVADPGNGAPLSPASEDTNPSALSCGSTSHLCTPSIDLCCPRSVLAPRSSLPAGPLMGFTTAVYGWAQALNLAGPQRHPGGSLTSGATRPPVRPGLPPLWWSSIWYWVAPDGRRTGAFRLFALPGARRDTPCLLRDRGSAHTGCPAVGSDVLCPLMSSIESRRPAGAAQFCA